jgi:hypothetical protein
VLLWSLMPSSFGINHLGAAPECRRCQRLKASLPQYFTRSGRRASGFVLVAYCRVTLRNSGSDRLTPTKSLIEQMDAESCGSPPIASITPSFAVTTGDVGSCTSEARR